MRRAAQYSAGLPASKTVRHTYLAKRQPKVDTALYQALTKPEQRHVDKVLAKLPVATLEQGNFASATASIEYYELQPAAVKLAFAMYGFDNYAA